MESLPITHLALVTGLPVQLFFFWCFYKTIVCKYKLKPKSNRHQISPMQVELDSGAWNPEIEPAQKPQKKKGHRESVEKDKGFWIERNSWIENGAERHLDRRGGIQGKLPFLLLCIFDFVNSIIGAISIFSFNCLVNIYIYKTFFFLYRYQVRGRTPKYK